MKRMVKRAKKAMRKYADDIAYLLITGLPTGLFLIVLGKVEELGEVF